MAEAKAKRQRGPSKMGRSSVYSDRLARQICSQIAVGRSVTKICSAEDMPGSTTVFRWLAERDDFRLLYARAKEDMVVALGEEILDISDAAEDDTIEVTNDKGVTYTQVNHAAVQRARLRIDTRKWLMSKLVPRKYGEGNKGEEPDDGKLTVVIKGGLPDADG